MELRVLGFVALPLALALVLVLALALVLVLVLVLVLCVGVGVGVVQAPPMSTFWWLVVCRFTAPAFVAPSVHARSGAQTGYANGSIPTAAPEYCRGDLLVVSGRPSMAFIAELRLRPGSTLGMK